MAKGDEKKLSSFVIRTLKGKIEKDFKRLLVSENLKVLSDLTCINHNRELKLGLGFAETDLAIYKIIDFDKSKITEYFRFISDASKDKKNINIPLVIIELKSGDITSDSIRARDTVARRIKDVFPFCAYYFLGENTTKTDVTLTRQGKSFNNYFIHKKKVTTNDIGKIYNDFIKPHILNLEAIVFLSKV